MALRTPVRIATAAALACAALGASAAVAGPFDFLFGGPSPETTAPAPPPDRGGADAAKAREGEALAARMNCGVCHLPTYAGRAQIPRVAGQREDYLVHALTQYRDGARRGSDTNMNAVMYGVTDAQIAALAHHLAQR
ncbi:MAG: c-type cytochrome [Acetobacteraceae bacterium]|nr:c-type cytochrome [Acetobacteraceae bacterium]